MAFQIKGSYIVAFMIAAGISGWIYTGSVVIGGQPPDGGSIPIAEREAERSSELFKVRTVIVKPESRESKLIVRGQTKATSVVPVRAQVDGILLQRLVNRGDKVSKGQVVCKIDVGSRKAHLARVQAQFTKAQADYTANAKLVEKGIVSRNMLNTMKASLDAAKAEITEAKLRLERSDIRANAGGIVQDPISEVGEMLSVGSACVTLVQSDPIKFTGQVSERDIDDVNVGAEADVELISGKIVTGNVRYISPSADSKTRTFLTEIVIPNKDRAIRVGMTARANITLAKVEAYRISPAWITLADDGSIGVRTVDENSIVHFVPVKIISQTIDTFWISGLQPGSQVISLGQEFVVAGEKVIAVPETRKTAGFVQ